MFKYIFCWILILPFSIALNAQVFSLGASVVSRVGEDSVYFYRDLSNAQLIAQADAETEIEWFSFNLTNNEFSTSIRKVTAKSDTLNVSVGGGYMARIASTDYYCWCFQPHLDSVSFVIDTICCDYMTLESKVHFDTLKIYNILKSQYIAVPQKITYDWLMNDTLLLTTNISTVDLDSPFEDGVLKVVARNQVGSTVTASDTVSAYAVKAKFSYEVRERSVDNEISKGDALSAPAEVEFTNLSQGQYTVCEWVMGNVSRLYDINPVYSFQKSGTYTVALIVTDENSQCSSIDSTTHIVVTEAALEFPNVFTPNGDGVNDEFRPVYKSLKSYSITIYNRWGRKIYSSSDPTTGWNGKEGNANAAEGVYMYVAEGEGYDKGVTFKRKGSVTLIR